MTCRNRLVDDLAGGDVEAGGEPRIGGERSAGAKVGEPLHLGEVALVSARVEVTGTAPGMLATQ